MLDEKNVIEHLFTIEREASELFLDAQDEYNKRLDTVREQAEIRYKKAYEDIVAQEEKRYAASVNELNEQKTNAFNMYCSELQNQKQDKIELFALLDDSFGFLGGKK